MLLINDVSAPLFVLGRIYQHLGEDMKLLWSRDLVMNTVHVQDIAHSIWYLVQRDDTEGQLFNVVDDSRTTQGHITDIISAIFNITCDFCGNVLSTLAKVSFKNSLLSFFLFFVLLR